MASSQNIVVWEWQDDYVNYDLSFPGLFIAYEPKISNEIEDIYSRGLPQPPFIVSVDIPVVANPIRYEINLNHLDQRNVRTGVRRVIRRTSVPPTTALASDHIWQWQQWKYHNGKKFWLSYATELVEQIESAFLNGNKDFIFPSKYNMPYKVDFVAMQQRNMDTGFCRQIRRTNLNGRYIIDRSSPTPYTKGGSPVWHSGVPKSIATNFNVPLNSIGVHSSINTSTVPPITAQSSGRSHLYSQQPLGYVVYPVPINNNGANQGTPPPYTQRNSPPPAYSVAPPTPPSVSPASSRQPGQNHSNEANSKKWKWKHVPWKPCPSGGISCQTGGAAAIVPVAQVISSYTNKVQVADDSTDQCSVCQSNLADESGFGNNKDTVELKLCKHVYHLECIEATYSHGVQNGCIVCPSCNKSHGVKTGDQPPGVMKYSSSSSALSGYSGHGTIRIEYHISPGTQSSEHPHPGQSFRAPAFPRIAYLPDNDEGRSILNLLIEAWKRRLIFTVGQSSTSGMENVVTWTGIHHKTSTSSHGGHGYPDPTYLDRVRDELETVGVVDEL